MTISAVTTIGSVSFLNSAPLIHGLDRYDDLRVVRAVPSRLLEMLENREVDIALLPVIDIQRLPDAVLIPVGGIGCDGPTLTVRIFSRVPFADIKTLACDPDSHTSVALSQIILAQMHCARPELLPLSLESADAQLLIGDKVVTDEPQGYPHQLDLGAAWKQLTGLPFVFAAWVTRLGTQLGDVPERLHNAHREAIANLQAIVDVEAPKHDWPIPLAMHYLGELLRFDVGPEQIEAIKRYHELAARFGAIPTAEQLRLAVQPTAGYTPG